MNNDNMKKVKLRVPDAALLQPAYERGLRYRKEIQAVGLPWRCERCRTCLKDGVRLLALSKIDRGYRIGKPLEQEFGVEREQLRDYCYFAAAVDTIVTYCGDEARELILQDHKYLDPKTVLRISRTAPARQRYEMEQARLGRRPLVTNGKGCPVYDTVDFKEILSRLRRAQGKLAAFLLGTKGWTSARASLEEVPAFRERLEAIRADTRAVILGVQAAPEGVPCPCDLAKRRSPATKPIGETARPADFKFVLGPLNQTWAWTGKCARDLPELLQTVSPIRREKEEVCRRGRAILQTAGSILRVLER